MRYASLLVLALCVSPAVAREQPREFDIVIYGGTSGGLAAGIQAKRMGKTVIVLEPSKRIGGLTTGGLGQTDIGNKAAIGGVSREFYQRIKRHYSQPAAWKWQKSEEYRSGGQSQTGQNEDTLWTFEPSAALHVYQDWLKAEGVPTLTEHRLDRQTGVKKEAGRIVSITMENGQEFRGKMFIDATYEGDLLAAAGVSYTVGREANATYDETLNGVQTARSIHHQFVAGVDPYIEKGNPDSGLLPFIDPNGPGEEGSQDKRVQAYCFRMCMTDHPENRIPWIKPEGYNEQWYELLLRDFEAGANVTPLSIGHMPNRKTDTNNNRGFSTDFIGQNYAYPEASYAEREQIVARHRLYQQGLMWTLANHPRMPEHIRKEVSRWGMCKDEFESGNGWQEQIYVREARRMIGATVMTQHHCQGRTLAERPVGLAAYTMDSHNVQRHVAKDGTAKNEGDVQVGGFAPYPIDYGSLIPKAEECGNLLVPVSLSASHIAFGSIRMEPVFMVLGQSSATAASIAIDANVAVQQVDYAKLRERLLQDGQRLEWTGPRPTPVATLDPAKLPGVVVDDEAAKRKGFEPTSRSIGPLVGIGYRHDDNQAKGQQSARFQPELPAAGQYEVRLYYSPNPNRATNVPVKIESASGVHSVTVNQRKAPGPDGYVVLGKYPFDKGDAGWVEISNAGTDGHVIIDAVQFVPTTK